MQRIVYIKGELVGNCPYQYEVVPHLKPCGELVRKACFLCRCGKEFEAMIANVKSGKTNSCPDCVAAGISARMASHGHTHKGRIMAEYNTWSEMKSRCNNPKIKNYHRYGGRGISVCPEWQNSYMAFYNDVGPKPTPQHSLDRIENSKGYYKENCRWATKKEQALNTRRNFYVSYMGESKPLKRWTDQLGINYDKASRRIKKGKWSAEKAFTTP